MQELLKVNALYVRMYKENMRKYFAIPEPDGLEYIHNIIDFLLNDAQINNLRETFGDEEYKKMLLTLNKYRESYAENLTHRRRLNDLPEDEPKNSKRRKQIETKLIQNCAKMPIAKITLWKMFYHLISRTELVRIVPPTASEQTEKNRKMSFASNEDMNELT